MDFRKILSTVLACSVAMNMLTGSILANATTDTSTTVATVPTTTTIDCSDCQNVLKWREALYEVTENLAKDPENQTLLDKRTTYWSKVSLLLNHECNEKTIYVENYPYTMHDYYGSYTGYWKGATPSDNGKFVGHSIYETSTFNTNTQITTKKYRVYTYDGNWLKGYHNGKGAYIIENYTTETTKSTGKEEVKEYTSNSYEGEFKDNKKNGNGSEKQVFSNGNYTLYGEGTYKNDVLQGTVAFEKYDLSNNLLESGNVKEDENGKKVIVEENKSKSSKLLKGALIAGAVIGGALLVDSLLSDDYNYSYEYETEEETMSAEEANRRYWADYHAKKEEKRKKEEEEAAERAKKEQEWRDNNYYYYKKTYGDDDSRTQQWKKWSGN